jgi:membrane carboxypeptidase/penicillin-binding protein PbpC
MDWYLPGISKTSSCKGDCLSKANNPSPAHTSPHIIRPINGQTFALLSDRENPSLALEAEGSGNLYWFVNGSFFRKSNAKEILQLPLEPGIYEITCTTDEGHADFVRIVVE